MSVLLLAEHNNETLNPGSRQALSAALQFGKPVTVLVAGCDCQSVAEQAAGLKGVDTVLHVDHEGFRHPLAETFAELLASFGNAYSVYMAASTTFGKNTLPRLAAKLDVTQISDVTNIIDEQTFEHPIYAGNAIERVKALDDIKVLSVRATAFDAIEETQDACPIEKLEKSLAFDKTKFISESLSQSTRPDLASASVVVSGGRGLQNAENFKMIEALADVLGAAVGASRAAVDAGFVPNDYQVGQTGKIVAPALYIAIGISGAVQHMAGMKDSKVIVAINKDEDAPIFQVADYGLVGDLFEIVPELIEKLKSR